MKKSCKNCLYSLINKRAMIIKRGQNENDNAIKKKKLTKRNINKALIVEYIHEKKNLVCYYY